MKVLVTDYAWPSLDLERALLAEVGAEIVEARTGEEDELIALAPPCDAILTCWKRVTPAVLDAAPRCRVVGRYGVGLDNIAVDHATELGIIVTNVPDFCIDEVSEHALALILALTRRVVSFARQTRGGDWDNQAAGSIHRLRGQTLGLVGCGRIGGATGAKARALGMEVLGFTRSGRVPDGIEPVAELDSLLERSDAVSLHLPLTPETEGLIGEAQLRRMKPSAFLVNTSRGAVVDQAALARALGEGWIGGAGLDVLASEPPDPADPLLALDAAIVTPHASFYSEESTVDLQRRAAACVATVLRGEVPETVVNKEVLDRPGLRGAGPPEEASEA
jgi:D-3-phosphoglycerate dehydrogenase / 2-oxoglutarate reductase